MPGGEFPGREASQGADTLRASEAPAGFERNFPDVLTTEAAQRCEMRTEVRFAARPPVRQRKLHPAVSDGVTLKCLQGFGGTSQPWEVAPRPRPSSLGGWGVASPVGVGTGGEMLEPQLREVCLCLQKLVFRSSSLRYRLLYLYIQMASQSHQILVSLPPVPTAVCTAARGSTDLVGSVPTQHG